MRLRVGEGLLDFELARSVRRSEGCRWARCVLPGVADKIRAWKGKPSAHAKKGEKPSDAQVLWGELSLRPDMTDKQRAKAIKPLQEAQKIIDNAKAERRTQRVIKIPRKHRKRVWETPVPSMPQVDGPPARGNTTMPQASEGGSTDSSMQDAGSDSDSESSDSGWDWSSDE